MRKTTAITVTLSLLLALWTAAGEACVTVSADGMPGQGAGDVADGSCHGSAAETMPAMDCCDDMSDGQFSCADCACPALSAPAGVIHVSADAAAPLPAYFARLGRASAPRDGPPGNLLRPPIVAH